WGGCVDERIEVSIFEQHRTHPGANEPGGFFTLARSRIEIFSYPNLECWNLPEKAKSICHSVSMILLLISQQRPLTARSASTNGSATTGRFSFHTRKTSLRFVRPSLAR